MSHNSTLIYEQAQQEQFENFLYSGQFTEARFQEMVDNGQLTVEQIQMVAERFPAWGGIKNVAKNALSGLKGSYQQGKQAAQQGLQRGQQAIQRGVQGAKDAYQQGVQQQQVSNAQRSQAKMWKNIDQTINNARLFEKLDVFRKSFPQDKFVNDATAYVNKVFLELQQYLAQQYPYMGIENQPGFQFQSEIDNQQRQRSAQAQADAAAASMDRPARQRPDVQRQRSVDAQTGAGIERLARNDAARPAGPVRKRSKTAAPLAQRQRKLSSESYKRR